MKRSPLCLSFVFAISMLATSVAHATDRFVSPTGDDQSGSNDCSASGTPCASFSNAISQSSGGDAIHAAAGTYNETGIRIDKDLTVDGAGQTATVIEAGGSLGPVVEIQGVTATVSNLTVQGGADSDVCGGGINSNDSASLATLINVTVRNNTTNFADGGGLCVSGQMTIQNSLIGGADNVADGNKSFGGNGGGIFVNEGELVLDNTVVSGNSTEDGDGCAGNGGGIYNDFGSNLTVTNSTISGNIANAGGVCGSTLAEGNGGGLFNTESIVFLDHTLVQGNQAMINAVATQEGGGGIFNINSDLHILNGSTIDGNFAVAGDPSTPTLGANGGGIYHTAQSILCPQPGCPAVPNLMISNSTISNNIAAVDGGGIYRDNPMTLTNVTISGNRAAQGEAGGIYNNGASATGCLAQSCPGTLTNVTIAKNTAFTTGGISSDNAIIPTFLKNTLVAENTQTSDNTNANCAPADTAIFSENHNLSDDGTCSNFFTQPDDFNSQAAGIGDLANNGGNYPSNPPLTHALLTGSKAIDAIPPADCVDDINTAITVDERNFPRPGVGFGPNCDIGAFELQAVIPTPIPTPLPSPTPIPTVFPDLLEGGGFHCDLISSAGSTGSPILAGLLLAPMLLWGLLRKRGLRG